MLRSRTAMAAPSRSRLAAPSVPLDRRRLLGLAAALPVALLLKLPPSGAQALADGPFAVGKYKVTPLFDGPFQLPLAVIPQAQTPAGAALMQAAGAPMQGPLPIPVNAYALEAGGRLALVDSGTGAMGGPDLGRMAGALRSAGLDPADVEALILTHLHIDHAGGAVDAAGKAVFPNAELILQDREFAFWTDDGIRARAPSDADIYFASARKVLAAYPNRIRRVSGEAELWQGLRFLPLPGHTPGHSGVLLQDGSAQLLLWADIIHAGVLQFPHPDWTLSYDVDQPQARETRARLLDRLAADRVPAAGAHLADRGLIVREGAGYRLIPQS